ncbi:multidrug transporter EmrE-like cation transporter [Cerasibacillus quisquiliarum]|uniref:Uncharacterized protein n=1 Tax=Cerasibacillus quisquiliarum TaxID=227865 RepID=A0A511UYR9_9BACI|nr:multidrug transporter EmrE-like cation transporter [Cerasibacillus quisquiliarum]GEN31780.1 hypothetical protein CQU01_20180 [Cerasibacillus quisquiliarum]
MSYFFVKTFKVTKIILILVLLAGVIGLKLVTKNNVQEGVEP